MAWFDPSTSDWLVYLCLQTTRNVIRADAILPIVAVPNFLATVFVSRTRIVSRIGVHLGFVRTVMVRDVWTLLASVVASVDRTVALRMHFWGVFVN